MCVCVQSPKVFRISHRTIISSSDMLLVSRILRSFVAMAIIRGTLTFDSLDRLLEDAIPVLFPPVRMSLHLCRLEQGKKRGEETRLEIDPFLLGRTTTRRRFNLK